MIDGIFALLLGLVFIFSGLVILWFIVHGYNMVRPSSKWLSVDGVIIESRIDSIGDDLASFDVAYEYYVNEVKYIGSNVSPFGVVENVQKALKKYPKGANVQVFYQSSKHDCALLELGYNPRIVNQMKVAFCFSFLVGVYLVYRWWA